MFKFLFKLIFGPSLCKICMDQGIGANRGMMYEGQCRCNPNGCMS